MKLIIAAIMIGILSGCAVYPQQYVEPYRVVVIQQPYWHPPLNIPHAPINRYNLYPYHPHNR